MTFADNEATEIAPEVQTLLDMVSYRRPHMSAAEEEFIERFISPLNPTSLLDPTDLPMCYMVEVAADNGGTPPIIFSSHVDTVHRNSGRQKVCFDANMGLIYKDDKEPLGADDAAGVWLLLQMIEANVPGRYLFHRGEECGGKGSKVVAQHHKDILEGVKYAVAFDRKADCSIITYQRGGRCCSDTFATALGARITARMPHHSGKPRYTLAPDDTGVYTDTAEYTSVIPECTNVSVGYYDEHTGNESLDLEYLLALRDAVIDHAMWLDLPAERDPSKVESKWGKYGGGSYGSSYGGYYGRDNDWWDDWPKFGRSAANDSALDPSEDYSSNELRGLRVADLRKYAADALPSAVAGTILNLIDEIEALEDSVTYEQVDTGDDGTSLADQLDLERSYVAYLENILNENGIEY